MTEIDALKWELQQKENAFNRLHKDYINLLKKQGELEKENGELKQKILDEIDLEIAYVNEVYSDGRMSIEQYDGAIICLQELRGKFE